MGKSKGEAGFEFGVGCVKFGMLIKFLRDLDIGGTP